LLAAFASLAAEFRGWNVEIIGPDDDQAYMQQLALLVEKHGLQHRVNFLPMLSGEALYRRYRASSIYCFPTCHEGVPMTIVEAMCYGGAIVAGNAGFISHQLDDGNAGMLFKPGDVAALAGCLRQLMASEDLRNGYMARARQRVVNTFVWERYFESIEAACARHITRLV
jgi:phosphatidylinositol alpha-mannosyltransferase